MWGLLILAAIVELIALYIPGYFFVRALRVSRLVAVVCAPFVTLAVYSVVTILYWKTGVFCTGWLLVGSSTVLTLLLYGISLIRAKKLKSSCFCIDSSGMADARRARPYAFFLEWGGLALYVVIGLLVCLYVLILNMESADSFIQYYDNLHHLGAIESFVTSGNWSSFAGTVYPTVADRAISPISDGSFYPSAWHCVASVATSVLGVSAPLAQNASILVFAGVVFPSCSFLLLRKLFSQKPSAVLFGAFVTMGFAIFPWRFITFGPLFPNMAAFAIQPALACCFLTMADSNTPWRRRVVWGSLFLMGLVGMAFTQPNAVFALAAFLAPFCVVLVGRLADLLPVGVWGKRFARVGFCALAVALIVGIWLACYKLPFMQGIVSYTWPAYVSGFQALKDTVRLAFLSLPTQLILALAVALGALFTLRHRKYAWLTCSYVIVFIMYVVTASSDGVLKHLLTGFWYTDPYRVAACLVMVAIPLASFGLGSLSDLTAAAIGKLLHGKGTRVGMAAVPCCIALAFCCLNYAPHYLLTGNVDDQNAFDVTGKYMREGFYNAEYGFYDTAEKEFVEEVERVVPANSLILNMPNDGSAFAYSADGLRVYYRYYDVDENGTEESRVIRDGLCDVATDETVQEALERVGANYVMLLDNNPANQDGIDKDYWLGRDQWKGILSITDDTPGFKVVLSEGDMRLYEIEAA